MTVQITKEMLDGRVPFPWDQKQVTEETKVPMMSDGLPKLDASGVTEYLTQTAQNVPRSAKQVAIDTVTPFLSPVETGKTLAQLGSSALGAMGVTDADPKMAEAVGEYFKDRYGGLDEALTTFRTDPVGMLADASGVLFLGSGVPRMAGAGLRAIDARTPDMPSATPFLSPVETAADVPRMGAAADVMTEAANVASRGASVIDPLTIAARTTNKALGAVGIPRLGDIPGAVTSRAVGALTGQSKDVPIIAYQAGRTGGEPQEAFLRQMRDRDANVMEGVEGATEIFGKMKKEMGQSYAKGMKNIARDRANEADIRNMVNKVNDDLINKYAIKTDEGPKTTLDGEPVYPAVDGKLNDVQQVVEKIRGTLKLLDDPEMHTIDNLDTIKQTIGDIYSTTNPKANVPVQQAYKAVREEIKKINPEYAKIMEGYEEAVQIANELTQTFGLGGPKAAQKSDTILRRLQSVMRDNANTTWGGRFEILNKLGDSKDSQKIMALLAGQSSSTILPRNVLQRMASGAGIAYAGWQLDGLVRGLLTVALGGASSPRISGEVANILGITARQLDKMREIGGPDIASLRRGAYFVGGPGEGATEIQQEQQDKDFEAELERLRGNN